ncbi:MAG: prephenate dehydrogenase [Candidatus Cohnella colombiensis]|uniref:Prephenate dehydrogenase n=1 Tax=Candidatus Cohnella colombiensis TaxID=3121368 RepID=A0AA95EY86_9BACL|nr:MAG: prephenate dehydrogenase [Cohnella sp.]
MSDEMGEFTKLTASAGDKAVKIAIFGVGLIGGSLALCFKGKPGIHVVGHSVNPVSVSKYIARDVVDEATTSLEEAARDADFLFVCVPVGMLDEYIEQLSNIELKPGCIITDVGSTKASVVHHASKLALQGGVFIGGHPMAGGERSGVEAASSFLFENAYYVLTPTQNTPVESIDKLEQLLKWTKAHIVKVDAVEHDQIVGAISHLPHMIASGLVTQVARYNETNGLYASLAAGGFRDITRIASSDPIIWRDILLNNRDVMLRLIQDWQQEMGRFAKLIESGDGNGIAEQFRLSGEFRNQLPERRKGMISSIFECYVDVPDHPGSIGKIATELGQSRINLSNLQIIESRDDIPGVLRLSFHTEEYLERAIQLLKELKYSVHM